MMNAIFFQSCQFVSVTECVSSCADSAKGINVRPFAHTRPTLNGLEVNPLQQPPRHHAHCALLANNRGQENLIRSST